MAITHGRFRPPSWWMEGACTVISIFLPYTDRIIRSNSVSISEPSAEWLHGRHEGQHCIDGLTQYLVDSLICRGYHAVAPSLDSRYYSVNGTHSQPDADIDNTSFGSNWSERHVAYAAGLGTFGLSKGLITKKGVAGRFTSVITDMPHNATPREYSDIYAYCSLCGACIVRCPVHAISFEKGKDHTLCSYFLDSVLNRTGLRYGCGKCQVHVPCSTQIPLNTAAERDNSLP